jgi:hypothetical protein
MADATCRVLVVEDVTSDARLIIKQLKRSRECDFEVDHVERLEPALTRIAENDHDVVLQPGLSNPMICKFRSLPETMISCGPMTRIIGSGCKKVS